MFLLQFESFLHCLPYKEGLNTSAFSIASLGLWLFYYTLTIVPTRRFRDVVLELKCIPKLTFASGYSSVGV